MDNTTPTHNGTATHHSGGSGTMDIECDFLGQIPSLDLYTQVCLCYALDHASEPHTQSRVVGTLTRGLERLTASFPWVAGQFVVSKEGVASIKPLSRIPPLVVKDLTSNKAGRQDQLTMDALRSAQFPMRLLDENVVAPRNTIPGTAAQPEPTEKPVFLVQATFIEGGLILTFVGHHCAMDMTGQAQVMHMLSKACGYGNSDTHGDQASCFTAEELASSNLARHTLVQLLDETDIVVNESDKLTPSNNSEKTSSEVTEVAPPVDASWASFTLSPSALLSLKAHASESLTTEFVSTDDAVTAFIWQSVAQVRIKVLSIQDPSSTVSGFGRAVDMRRFLGIPETYPGMIQNMAHSVLPIQELVDAPLGAVASLLRKELDPQSLAYRTRALATKLQRHPSDQTKASATFVPPIDMTTGLMLSSWSKVNCYDLEFGLQLGVPEAVRRPRFITVPSLGYLLPRRQDGEIGVAICLPTKELELLKSNPAFSVYVQSIDF
eukprot:TRINITY_DN1890_c0_g1_i1.p1 TRINITY_DN1890_c0_g1~~TRINITY_DN1890_c0_g1_i1.p1  ORF type:complete len:493 (-),score=51.09 TRINITY_DN1890_c0_g1_i1:33-1511(-)